MNRLLTAYFSSIAHRKLWSLWWVALVALVVIAVGFAVDLRVAIVGFMLLLIVYPLAMTLAVFSSALRPEVVRMAGVESARVADGALLLFGGDGSEIGSVSLDGLRSVSEAAGLIRITDSTRRLVIVPAELLTADERTALYRAVPAELS